MQRGLRSLVIHHGWRMANETNAQKMRRVAVRPSPHRVHSEDPEVEHAVEIFRRHLVHLPRATH